MNNIKEVKRMRFSEEKINEIKIYILNKINREDGNISKAVAENFGINQNTAHKYINKLIEDGIIERAEYGKYKLIAKKYEFHLTRKGGELNSDMYAFNTFFKSLLEKYANNVFEIWQYSISEMTNNVMDHSNAEDLYITINQNYLNTFVSLYDNGIGIFEKIKDYFNYESIEDAICELSKGKLTTDSSCHSGEGIFFTSKAMDEFFIESKGKKFIVNRLDESGLYEINESGSDGTTVYMGLSNQSRKRISEIFDTYSDIDNGFNKTKIVLKNIFDSSPISRSQARRVCNNLNKFKEVTVDFSEIEWVGQGFADQLFRVFAADNPDIKIIPENMNEVVSKMYNHILNS